MSLKDYDQPRQQVARIQARLNEAVADIQANKNYSPVGRRSELAQATLQARQQVEQLKGQFTADREARRKRLEADVFGTRNGQPIDGSDILSIRDAEDRAGKLETEKDAAAMLHTANRNADEFLAKAIASHAHHRGWVDVTNDWAHTWQREEALQMLEDTPAGRNTTMADASIFRVMAPTEIAADASSDQQLQRVAEMGDQ